MDQVELSMLVDIGLKFYAVTTHLSDIEVKVFGHRFNRFSGKAQVRRATLSCDSSYYSFEYITTSRIMQGHFQMIVFIYMGLSRKHVFRKTCSLNEYPNKPQFYIEKLGFAGVYLSFFFLFQNTDCGYSLEPPRGGGSNVYPQSII